MTSRSALSSPYVLTERRIALWNREGRGRGEGASYKPWLTTRNVRSQGRKHRIPGILHGRVHHLMSDLERNALFHFERQPGVLEVREQFPLDREVTRGIARAMRVTHPTDPFSHVEIVMTSDLLVIFVGKDGRPVARPFSVKEASDMLAPRTQVKQEIERRYWERLGFRWKPLFDNVLRESVYFEALRWIREWFHVDGVDGLDEVGWQRRRAKVIAALSRSDATTLGEFTQAVDQLAGWRPGDALSTLRHLAARRLVDFDPRAGVPTLASPLARFSPLPAILRLAA